MNMLFNKKIIVIVAGGIAAYKSPEVVRVFKQAGAEVKVVMTKAAAEFTTALALQAVSGNFVHTDLFNDELSSGMGHIELAKWADAIVIAPATANFISNLTAGRADDLATSICLASDRNILIAPAMNVQMWENSITQENIESLKSRDFSFLGPTAGELACGDVGQGRMSDPDSFPNAVYKMLKQGIWQGKNVVITAGPTIEPIDPVRFISNHSSGAMGYEIARRSAEVGANVTLISGPSAIKPPYDCETINVETADQMFEKTFDQINNRVIDIVFCVAAVCDYKPLNYSKEKIKKRNKNLTFELVRNKDILAELCKISARPFLVGFAAETDDLEKNGLKKFNEKGCDVLAANDVSSFGSGFNSQYNELLVISKKNKKFIANDYKYNVAKELIDFVHSEINS